MGAPWATGRWEAPQDELLMGVPWATGRWEAPPALASLAEGGAWTRFARRPRLRGVVWRRVARAARRFMADPRDHLFALGTSALPSRASVTHRRARHALDAPPDDPAKAGSPREARPGSPFSERSERRGRLPAPSDRSSRVRFIAAAMSAPPCSQRPVLAGQVHRGGDVGASLLPATGRPWNSHEKVCARPATIEGTCSVGRVRWRTSATSAESESSARCRSTCSASLYRCRSHAVRYAEKVDPRREATTPQACLLDPSHSMCAQLSRWPLRSSSTKRCCFGRLRPNASQNSGSPSSGASLNCAW